MSRPSYGKVIAGVHYCLAAMYGQPVSIVLLWRPPHTDRVILASTTKKKRQLLKVVRELTTSLEAVLAPSTGKRSRIPAGRREKCPRSARAN